MNTMNMNRITKLIKSQGFWLVASAAAAALVVVVAVEVLIV